MLGFFSLLDQAYPWYNRVMRLDKLGQAGYGSRNQAQAVYSAVRYTEGIWLNKIIHVDASL